MESIAVTTELKSYAASSDDLQIQIFCAKIISKFKSYQCTFILHLTLDTILNNSLNSPSHHQQTCAHRLESVRHSSANLTRWLTAGNKSIINTWQKPLWTRKKLLLNATLEVSNSFLCIPLSSRPDLNYC